MLSMKLEILRAKQVLQPSEASLAPIDASLKVSIKTELH